MCGFGGFRDGSGEGAMMPPGMGFLEYKSSIRPSGLMSVCLNMSVRNVVRRGGHRDRLIGSERRMGVAPEICVRVDDLAAGRAARDPFQRKLRSTIAEEQAIRFLVRVRKLRVAESRKEIQRVDGAQQLRVFPLELPRGLRARVPPRIALVGEGNAAEF